MQIYLPIAGVSVNVLLLLGLGGLVGFLSGLFGVGGGFLRTPLLMLLGIPPAVAVATGANQVVASSISGVLAHMRRGNVDFKMGIVLMLGGLVGSGAGVGLYTLLRHLGHLDLVIAISFVVFLVGIGSLMLFESVRAILRIRRGAARRKLHQHTWLHGLPFKMRFPRSRLYISVLPPLAIGFFVGMVAATMGVTGFVMVPAMIYLLGMPTITVIGTSLFQIIFVTANITMLQSIENQTVDVVLAIVLLVTGVIGAQFGSRFAGWLPPEVLRGLLALVALAVGVHILFGLFTTPADFYTLGGMMGAQ